MSLILIVEDSRLSCCMIVDALREAGPDIFEAANGEEGLKSFCQDRPDCVVTDLLMPVMDGQELLRRIRAIDSDIPIIVLSANIQRSPRTTCEELGISEFLPKPIQPESLRACVDAALSQKAGVELDEA